MGPGARKGRHTMPAYAIETDIKPGIDRITNDADKSSVMFNRYGGELIGYDVFDPAKSISLPLLWNNNNPEPPPGGGWKNHAIILFPIVGGLVNEESRLGEVTIRTRGNHGFARHSLFTLAGGEAGKDSAQIHYQLKPNDEIHRYYPFGFVLDLFYTLSGNELTLTFQVTNADDQPIHFCFGWHPGFSTDLGLGGKKKDWQIVLAEGNYDNYLVNADCLLTGEIRRKHLAGPLKWDEEALEGTILLTMEKKEQRTCTLYNPKLDYGLKVNFADYPHLGIWSEKGSPFICIEPWQGMDDHLKQEPFDQKVGIVKLPSGESIAKQATVVPFSGGRGS